MPAVLSSVRETHSRADSKKFVYDQVSGRDGTQEGIFESVGKPMCESVLQGYNATIFAYGQTGAGKTFTMMGSGEGAEGENKGLIQRVFQGTAARVNGDNGCAQQLHTIHIGTLTFHIFATHVDDALQTVACADGGGCYAVLSRTRLRNDTWLAHAFG